MSPIRGKKGSLEEMLEGAISSEQTPEDVFRLAARVAASGFGKDPVFLGKDRAGNRIVNRIDKLQLRNRLFMIGYTNQTAASELAVKIVRRLLIPILTVLAHEGGSKTERKIAKSVAMYVLNQGCARYAMGELRKTATFCNSLCEAQYDKLYASLATLPKLTTSAIVQNGDTRHPLGDLRWLEPKNNNTIAALFNLLRARGVLTMTEFCDFVASCQGSYKERYYYHHAVVNNFWTRIFPRLLVGQAEKLFDEQFHTQLLKAVPERFHSYIRQAPVKTMNRVGVKSIEYSTFSKRVEALAREVAAADLSNPQVSKNIKAKRKQIHEEFKKCAALQTFADRVAARGVIDIARRSIVVNTEEDLVVVYKAVAAAFPVVRVKNGFHPDANIAGGYRDVKLNLIVTHSEAGWEVTQITELQLTLKSFMKVKKLSHVPYTILRGDFD